MTVPLFQVDAFTDRPFAGNPAAVCLLAAPATEAWMQDVAREMNLAETAFLVPRGTREAPRVPRGAERGGLGGPFEAPHPNDGFDLRWFTPAVEVALCGHATLASAHALWEMGRVTEGTTIRFHTKSGVLTAARRGAWIELDFPVKPEESAEAPPALLEALGVGAKYVGRNQFDYLVEVDGDAAVRALRPDFRRLASLPVRGVIVTAPSADARFDFVSRFFAPGSGIDEDPVTGSAHCCLGPFWGARLGKTELTGYQASARGGVVRVTLAGQRALLGGQAVTVLRGELGGP